MTLSYAARVKVTREKVSRWSSLLDTHASLFIVQTAVRLVVPDATVIKGDNDGST